MSRPVLIQLRLKGGKAFTGMGGVIRWLLTGCALCVVSACANHRIPILGADGSPLQVKNTFTPAAIQPVNSRRPINVIIHVYEDGRADAPARRIGAIRDTFVSDMTGTEIALDQGIAELVTSAMRRQLTAAGYHVIGGEAGGAAPTLFVINGLVAKFGLDVLSRDKVDIEVQTRVTEVGTGEVIWSGTVKEQTERFAGVSGDSRASLVSYLDKSLQHVTEKTVRTFTATLVQLRPELFLQAGVPTPGVTVQTAPPARGEGGMQAPSDQSADGRGELSITTEPAGVQVYVGDVYYGTSPLSLKLVAGIYSLRLTADGYREVTQKVSVRSRETTKWQVRMRH